MVFKLPRLAWFSCLATIAAMSLLNLYCAASIQTDRVPMQWGINGRPTWYADKTIGLWIPVAIIVVIAPQIFLKIKQVEAQAGTWYWIGMIAMFCFIAAVYAWHISAVMTWAEAQP